MIFSREGQQAIKMVFSGWSSPFLILSMLSCMIDLRPSFWREVSRSKSENKSGPEEVRLTFGSFLIHR